MPRGVPVTIICGAPLRFCNLDRPRTDYTPACHRPPHKGTRHMSLTAVEHARRKARERAARRDRARRQVLAA
jgi:hypothetical protein